MRLFTPLLLIFYAMAPFALADNILVFSAASLKAPLDEIAAEYEAQSGDRVTISYAATSTLARQIEFGAPADLFLSAHPDWIEYVAQFQTVPVSVTQFSSNRLVIAGNASADPLPLTSDGLTNALGRGRLGVPMIASVPLGIYAKEALEDLNLWVTVQGKLAETDNALTTRKLLELGEVPMAVLYESDVREQDGLKVLAKIPPQSHSPIKYEAMTLAPTGEKFAEFLRSPVGQMVLRDHGFRPQ